MAAMAPAAIALALLLPLTHALIDRQSIVLRYPIVRTSLINESITPLMVGNGDFAYSVDNTGMQSFLPYNTMSSWGWHFDALPTNGEKLQDYKGLPLLTHNRTVHYPIPDPALPSISQYLIANPNRINLGRIGLKLHGATLTNASISHPRQVLDPWSGTITSEFTLRGVPVKVVTQADFDTDAVVFAIESELVRDGGLQVELDFPYPPIHTAPYKYEVFAGSYNFPNNHTTIGYTNRQVRGAAHIYHELQETKYFVNLRWPPSRPLSFTKDEPRNSTSKFRHRYTLSAANRRSSTLTFTAHFSPERTTAALPSVIQKRNPAAWHDYWNDGGFIDLTASPNEKADELQRRIILSQYHVRVNSAASREKVPPQESGLMNNGWWGKFHMEMVIWHMGHWYTFGKNHFADSVFPVVYEKLLPTSLERAADMGWKGARSAHLNAIKNNTHMAQMAKDDRSGHRGERSRPHQCPPPMAAGKPYRPTDLVASTHKCVQPHPMLLASLAYQANPTHDTLQRWDRVITETANYMASYAWKNESSGLYDLGPPSYGVTENTPPYETLNLAYEISYWRYGLDVAISWKTRLGQPVPASWTTVAPLLAKPPQIDGLYAAYEGLNATWWDDPALTGDPRSLNMLKGFLPDTPAVDDLVAQKTADKIAEVWTDDRIRGWGRPILAINSARVGRPDRAVYHLTAYDYWKFDDAGYAIRGGDGGTPPPFMPGNAGLLYAVSYMAAGWNGSQGEAPGFPDDGTWIVKHEGLVKAL
ncbi:hypothetical protein S7711_03084 [Stachybotrys chartarum IBT 7711]|uniref:Six-hairpin glycosidase-like protein n=1 Tax=Stachybotrys chartarum (strain CBS 109288 / IBT 7711) TaxID=1280523 RepID=A0A084B897_STACB|nr:hypothetical protein S7711_03084 [Stachybotrys chartarum IBT 7711]